NPITDATWTPLQEGQDNVLAVNFNIPGPPARRRGAAAMAILADALFEFGEEETLTQNMEHFTMHYGDFAGPPQEIAPNVFERKGTLGLVVGNFAAVPYTYTDPIVGHSFVIAPQDGLAAQFKDPVSGRLLDSWVTNLGQ